MENSCSMSLRDSEVAMHSEYSSCASLLRVILSALSFEFLKFLFLTFVDSLTSVLFVPQTC